jgi:hypothetical protein
MMSQESSQFHLVLQSPMQRHKAQRLWKGTRLSPNKPQCLQHLHGLVLCQPFVRQASQPFVRQASSRFSGMGRGDRL